MIEAGKEIVRWLRRKRVYRGYPHIRDSRVEHLNGIDPSARVSHCVLSGSTNLGAKTILDQCEIVANEPVAVGKYSVLTGPIRIVADLNPVSIGRYCSLAPNVAIWEASHQPHRISTYFVLSEFLGESFKSDVTSRGPVTIGNDVWVGTRALILSGVEIGDGAIIGAGAVVTRDIPAYAVAVGSPARVVKYRFPSEIRERLLDLRWWLWEPERIRRNEALFRADVTSALLDAVR